MAIFMNICIIKFDTLPEKKIRQSWQQVSTTEGFLNYFLEIIFDLNKNKKKQYFYEG